MGIVQDENGKYRVSCHIRHPITRKPYSIKRTNINSRVQAEKVYKELVVKLDRLIREKMIPSWEVFLTDYQNSLSGSGILNATIDNRLSVLRFNTLPDWREKLLTEIGTDDIHAIVDQKSWRKSESHKKFFLSCLKSVLEYGVKRGLIPYNPTPLLKFKSNHKIKSGLNEQQIFTFLRRAQELDWCWYPHCAVAIYTGMRNGELYALKWDRVDLTNRKIIVDVSWSSKDGFKSTKSGDDRILEIPKPLLPLLVDLKLKSGGSLFVLPRMRRWDKGEQARELRVFLKSIGLPEMRFHDLRASWATWLLSKGVAPSKVMIMGGWKDLDTLMIYVRKAGIDIVGATSVLDCIDTHGVLDGQIISLHSNNNG